MINTIRKIELTTWLFLTAQLLDGLTTIIFLSLGWSEGNNLAYRIGWPGFITMKTVTALLFIAWIQFGSFGKWMDYLFITIAGLPVIWNIFVIMYLIIK